MAHAAGLFASAAAGCAVASVCLGGATSQDGIPKSDPPGWHRVLADDFNHGLDTSRWGRYSGQPGGDPGGWWEPSHVVVRNGVLRLETYRDSRYGGRWVSGGVSSAPGLKQTYGKYLVRFRMDAGKGVAGVLLLFPSGDHWPPEIDFAESGGQTSARAEMSATLHYSSDNRQIQHTVHADFTRWHVMGVEWKPGRLVYTLDGRPWARIRSAHVPSERMEMDLQTQAGTCGDEFDPCPDATTPAQVNMLVDWVVAYAYRPGSRR
jgi:beta-glucanase (GH16 family)